MIQGTGYGKVPPRWEEGLMDFAVTVSDVEAIHWKTLLAKREALHVGYSAAANVCAAAQVIVSGRLRENPTVVTLLGDSGTKYE